MGKVVRRNKQEYDALAKIIEKHPERKLTDREIETLESEIHGLNTKKQTLMQKLEMRQKQFHVLIYSVQLLQQILEDDQEVNEVTIIEAKSEPKKPIEVMDLT